MISIALDSRVVKQLFMDFFHRGATLFKHHNFLLLYILHFVIVDSPNPW
jgi:hypothetical protein